MRSDLQGAIQQANQRWPGYQFKRQTSGEASGPCPFCCGGDDRFNVFAEGNYWCRVCGEKGWLDEEDEKWTSLSEDEKERRRLEARVARLERQQRETERRLSALERMHRCKDHLTYHNNLTTELMGYWVGEGITVDSMVEYQLGYCPRCPTDRDGRPSYTIPVKSNGQLWNIRHRLLDAPSGDKYRPHIAGLPAVLFNADDLRQDAPYILVVEGEKKSIHAHQLDLPNVGIMGMQGFKPEWARRFDRFRHVYVTLDPDAYDKAVGVARLFGGRGRVVRLPLKLDDMVVRYGATADDVRHFIRLGKPVRA